jgi:glucose/arabinose dehydrogenase
MRHLHRLSLTLVFLGVLDAAPILPTGWSATQITNSLSSAVAMTRTPDGRLLVTQQGGQIRVVENNTLLANNFASFAVNNTGERGLLGITVSPNFAVDNQVYVFHTVAAAGANPAFNRVSTLTANGNTASSGPTTLINLSPLTSATNHNGGALRFGPDGKLYVSTGDNATTANSQSLANLHGKILRYNQDGTIPGDNPTSFSGIVGSPTGDNRAIYQVGLRNPFTMAFSPNGQLFINDVGASSFEEINSGAAGANFGWPGTEGTFNPASFPNFTNPLYAYSRGSNDFQGFAIAGGAFNGVNYYFGDFVRGWVNVYNSSNGQTSLFGRNFGNIVDIMPTASGNGFYVLTRDSLFQVANDAAVPEPSTWLAAAAGLGVLVLKKKLGAPQR